MMHVWNKITLFSEVFWNGNGLGFMFVFQFSTSATAVDPLIQKSDNIGYQSNKKLPRQKQNAENHLNP